MVGALLQGQTGGISRPHAHAAGEGHPRGRAPRSAHPSILAKRAWHREAHPRNQPPCPQPAKNRSATYQASRRSRVVQIEITRSKLRCHLGRTQGPIGAPGESDGDDALERAASPRPARPAGPTAPQSCPEKEQASEFLCWPAMI